jgi:hypothetical protein
MNAYMKMDSLMLSFQYHFFSVRFRSVSRCTAKKYPEMKLPPAQELEVVSIQSQTSGRSKARTIAQHVKLW